jgi:hypothetical protein
MTYFESELVGRRSTRGARKRRDVGELRAFEYGDKGGVVPGRANRIDRVARGFRRYPSNDARREQDELVTTLIQPVAFEDLLAQPGEVDRLTGRGYRECAGSVVCLRAGGRGGKHHRPEPSRPWHRGPPPVVRPEIGDEKRRVERRAGERTIFDLPGGGQPLEHGEQASRRRNASSCVRRIEIQSHPNLGRGQLGDGSDEIGKPSFPLRDEGADELRRFIQGAANECFPDGFRSLPAREPYGILRDAQARRRRHERTRTLRCQIREQLVLGREPGPGVIVQRQQPVIEQRRVAGSEDFRGEALR